MVRGCLAGRPLVDDPCGKFCCPIFRSLLMVAFLLAFIASWDEVTFAVFIGPISTPTLPSRMFAYLQELSNPSVSAVATMLAALTVSAGLVSVLLPRLRRRPVRLAP